MKRCRPMKGEADTHAGRERHVFHLLPRVSPIRKLVRSKTIDNHHTRLLAKLGIHSGKSVPIQHIDRNQYTNTDPPPIAQPLQDCPFRFVSPFSLISLWSHSSKSWAPVAKLKAKFRVSFSQKNVIIETECFLMLPLRTRWTGRWIWYHQKQKSNKSDLYILNYPGKPYAEL